MMLGMQILVVLAVVLTVYAAANMLLGASAKPEQKPGSVFKAPAGQDHTKDEKIQRLQSRIVSLESELAKLKQDYSQGHALLKAAEEKEAQLTEKLNNRQAWVDSSEKELSKAKSENQEFKNKIIIKENELQDEFAKNVNLNRQLTQLKIDLQKKEKEDRQKAEQLEIQKYQIEKQVKELQGRLLTISELQEKEKNSQWVPKEEFVKLNEEYSRIEKELEAKDDKIKLFSDEIVQLKRRLSKKPENMPLPAAEEPKKEIKTEPLPKLKEEPKRETNEEP